MDLTAHPKVAALHRAVLAGRDYICKKPLDNYIILQIQIVKQFLSICLTKGEVLTSSGDAPFSYFLLTHQEVGKQIGKYVNSSSLCVLFLQNFNDPVRCPVLQKHTQKIVTFGLLQPAADALVSQSKRGFLIHAIYRK